MAPPLNKRGTKQMKKTTNTRKTNANQLASLKVKTGTVAGSAYEPRHK